MSIDDKNGERPEDHPQAQKAMALAKVMGMEAVNRIAPVLATLDQAERVYFFAQWLSGELAHMRAAVGDESTRALLDGLKMAAHGGKKCATDSLLERLERLDEADLCDTPNKAMAVIREAINALRVASTDHSSELEREVEILRQQSAENWALARQWCNCHDALLSFIQKRPEMLKALIENDPRPPTPNPESTQALARSATRRSERCKTQGHVWVGIGDDGRVVCDDCGIEKTNAPRQEDINEHGIHVAEVLARKKT